MRYASRTEGLKKGPSVAALRRGSQEINDELFTTLDGPYGGFAVLSILLIQQRLKWK